MDIKKQIAYWKQGAEEDIDVSQVLIDKRKWRHALFFAHLALEKMLKATIVHTTKDIPPKIHNLVRLAHLTNLNFTDEQLNFFRLFNVYNIEGRYPDEFPVPISNEVARREMDAAREMIDWLKAKL